MQLTFTFHARIRVLSILLPRKRIKQVKVEKKGDKRSPKESLLKAAAILQFDCYSFNYTFSVLVSVVVSVVKT